MEKRSGAAERRGVGMKSIAIEQIRACVVECAWGGRIPRSPAPQFREPGSNLMPPTVQRASFPAFGCDVDAPLTATNAAALVADGFAFALRCLSGGAQAAPDLTGDEVAIIVGAGLALMPVHHVRYASPMPSAELGTADGQRAVAYARACGFPPGVTVWCDPEVQGGGGAETIAYIDAWAGAVRGGGYDPGVYFGSGVPLDGRQLYALSLDRYWKSQSQVSEPACGWTMIQLYPETSIAGIAVDVYVIQQDYRGRLPNWLTA